LFPPDFAQRCELKDDHISVKHGLPIRRILLKDDTAYTIRPSFLSCGFPPEAPFPPVYPLDSDVTPGSNTRPGNQGALASGGLNGHYRQAETRT
jgi:hypothetical protein